ncbi:telomere length regulation protein TEL2 homolog [Corythoichthys intestinalis]|uniref:telomere length regulation protein TEL2 homolog n=1 Tax=Corythoichthys intestinalis TaxID=161448 RepID=UPI0025A50958|nr:telomere length regulation protein TEL2 homolog [Corythoichthys intestinalis]XP_057682953.1 telomere length regulation protein TEL2 homolog [Corythoichthys intestinalis]XP_061807919.1 telomere length regulation protein TEL2 homolog [Nerophis lumbriciformis]
MESSTRITEVRLEVSHCFQSLTSSAHKQDAILALQTLRSYLDETPENASVSGQRTEFLKSHFTRTLQFLVRNIGADWLHGLTVAQRSELWDGLFLHGPPEQTLLVLMEAIGELKPSSNLDHLVSITERFIKSGRLAEMLWSYCLATGPADSPQIRETLLARIVALPDLAANKLQHNNNPTFLPQHYYPLLAKEMLTALERTCMALKDGTNCSLVFVAQVFGKLCAQGHSASLMAVMIPKMSSSTRTDMVWQRVCQKLLENVPQRWMESVLTGLVQAVHGPDALGRIMGNLVVTNKTAQFVITHKLLLLQHKYETRTLRVILGYLAAEKDRRPLLIQVLRSVSQAWANPSAVKHTPLEQQMYVSKALLLCVCLLEDAELQELRSELLQCMLGGMQSHLDSNVVRIRHMGMVVGEGLSSRMNINGTKLKFEYEEDEETRELVSLLIPLNMDESEPESEEGVSLQEIKENQPDCNHTLANEEQEKTSTKKELDSDLDSDDEFTPYDMSGDKELNKSSPPRYLRDCLENLISSEEPERVELSLMVAESLVRKNAFATKEISVQLSKVLLHMEDKYNINGFLALRQATMVALVVTDCIPVTQYLTTEFYSLNYSLRQRLDILEVLAVAAQELSKPALENTDPSVAMDLTPYSANNTAHWQQVVEKRIQSKTRRISKGGTKAPAKAAANRYAPFAGYFFFPLLRNYDKPQVTFDLLGGDHLVLGRLIHTLGVLMHLAVNAPVAAQMGRALLDFVWAVHYHTDQMVRRSVLFAVCSVFMSMPSQNLLVDLADQLFETRSWLADVAEGDLDADCRNLAMQSLVLLDKSLKKQLQNPQALSIES